MIYLIQKITKIICVTGVVLMANLTLADVKPSVSNAEDLMKGLLSFKYFRPNSNFLPVFIYNNLPGQIKNIIKLPENSNLYGSLVNGAQVKTVFSTDHAVDEVKKYFANRDDLLPFMNELLSEKIIKFLRDNAQIKTVKAGAEKVGPQKAAAKKPAAKKPAAKKTAAKKAEGEKAAPKAKKTKKDSSAAGDK